MTAGRNVSKSVVPPSASSLALSAAPFATVRIVPSLGFMTALYAVSTALSKASAHSATVTSLFSRAILQKPRKSWDMMTPEFPLAPRRDPEEMALQIAFISAFSPRPVTSRTAETTVMVMLVPVSPSGTGNTFSSLIQALFASRFWAPQRNILVRSSAFIDSVLTYISSCIRKTARH